jgi:predicted RNA binding protein YcfA (HicA-like mRNA interferase family)|tara:strand:- start:201 stop:1049 length:849 start_codon:yes stop_codon:yes gene_type:complete
MRYQEFKEDKFNKCYDYAEQLYTRAKQKGLDAELVQVAGYQGDDTLADKRWKEIPKKYWKHYVVKMGTTVLDPSASQFDPNAETKYPERTLNKMWDEQYVIKEMSHREAEKILKKNNFHKERAHGSHEVYKNDDTGETFALPHKHHTKDLSKGVEHDLKKVVAEGEDDAGWYRGISKQEADNIRKGGLPNPSAVPIPMDNEVMDYLGIDDEEALELQKEVEGTAVINVTNDEQNAEGYGDEVLWFERSLIDLDFKPYGLINIDTLQRNPKSWGLVTPWDEQQ